MAPRLMQGSDAVADAAILAGCRFFTGYPMLPFTELLENMAKKLPAAGGVCINADSEMEAINMALGAAATGARAATGSCGQGISLMQEGIAELALNELPLVVFNMARGQQDYFQSTRGGGWGDYRTITLAPKDIPEAVAHTQELFYLADRYRTPVILYGDYVIAHTSVGIEVEALDFGPLEPKDWALDGTMSGTGRARQIWTWTKGKPNTPGVGPDRAWNNIADKYAHIEATEQRFESYRAEDAETLIVSFGTTSVFVDRVVDDLRAEGVSVGSFRPITLWPFPALGLAEATKGKRHVLVYELNAGQMIDDVRMYAHDRSVIRAIGGVSQDESGMRQGDLLNADEVRRQAYAERWANPSPPGYERSRMTAIDITTAPERAARRVAEFKPDLLQTSEHELCPGCGHPVAWRLVLDALVELELSRRAILIAGHGCYTQLMIISDIDSLQCLHGRAPAVATGVKRMKPEAAVVTLQGDGDMASEGLHEVLHAAARGEKVTALLFNNGVFGDTGGHMTATTVIGQRTKTSLEGRDAAEHGYPIDVARLLSHIDGAAYVARGAVNTPGMIARTKRMILRALELQMAGAGFTFVEVLTMCPTGWFVPTLDGPEYLEDSMMETFGIGELKSPD